MSKEGALGADAGKLTFTKVLTALVALVSAMLLSRFRTLDEYGTYSQLLLVGNLSSSIFMLGLPNSVNYFLGKARDETERRAFLSVYYLLSTFLGILTGLILVLSVPLIESYFGNSSIGGFAYFLATIPWARIVLAGIDHVLVVYRRLNVLLWFKVSNACALLASVLIVEFLSLGFSAYMILFAMVEVGFALAVFAIVPSVAGRLSWRIDLGAFRQILAFSIPLGIASSTSIVITQFDKLIIGRAYDASALAVYANASREIPVTLIAASVTAVVMPVIVRLLAEQRIGESVYLWGRATLIGFSVISVVAAGIFVFPQDVLTLLYSSKYSGGAVVMQAYALILLLRCTYFGMMLTSTGRSFAVLWTSVLTLVLSVAFGLVGLRIFGFAGPAIGAFLAIAVTQFGQLLLSSYFLRVPIVQIFPWRSLGGVLLLNIGLALTAVGAKASLSLDRLFGSVFESVVIGGVWVLVYIAVLAPRLRRWWSELRDPGVPPASSSSV